MRVIVFVFLLTCIFLSCMSEQTSNTDKAQPKQQSKAVKAALKKYDLCGDKDDVCRGDDTDQPLFNYREGEVRTLQDTGAAVRG